MTMSCVLFPPWRTQNLLNMVSVNYNLTIVIVIVLVLLFFNIINFFLIIRTRSLIFWLKKSLFKTEWRHFIPQSFQNRIPSLFLSVAPLIEVKSVSAQPSAESLLSSFSSPVSLLVLSQLSNLPNYPHYGKPR